MKFSQELASWIKFSQGYLHKVSDSPYLISYGNGYNGWGNQTNQKAFAAFAIAALDEDIRFEDYGLTRSKVKEQALAMLRFNLESHIEGSITCADGEKWGHTWISVLGTERMMHAVEALWNELTPADHRLLRRVLLSEADWLLENYEIIAGLPGDKNKPESNIWNGAALLRCTLYYPDCPNFDRYIEKGIKFLVNGISVPSDEQSEDVVDGYKVKDLFVGANMYENYACDHHNYMNVGYMVICLSNIAMLYFSYKSAGVKPPQALMRHAYELWQLIRTLTFDDGRLIRIGGDSRARYCYCQDYALPMWMFVCDAFGEDCSGLMRGWMEILHKEIKCNGDGSFLSERAGYLEEHSLIYYTRLESDRAVVLSMLQYWSGKFGIDLSGKSACTQIASWQAECHGAGFVKNKKRLASFIWRSSEPPQGMCVNLEHSDLAEWRFNLSGEILGGGALNPQKILSHNSEFFDGGFVTSGIVRCMSEKFITEQQNIDHLADKYIAFAALPDDCTILCIQYAVTLNYSLIKSVKSVLWNVPNDIFNSDKRAYYFNGASRVMSRNTNCSETVELGNYLNVDNALGIASPDKLYMYRPESRQVEIRRYAHYDFSNLHNGTLYCDEVIGAHNLRPKWREKGDILIDTSFAMNVGNALETSAMAQSIRKIERLPENVRGISVDGADGKRYTLVFNFSESSFSYADQNIAPVTAKLIRE